MNRKVVTGIDLIYLPRFKNVLKKGGQTFLHRIFHESEITGKVPKVSKVNVSRGENIAHLAGIFAAKEAAMKALELPIDSWHDIIITHLPSGAPKTQIRNSKFEIRNCSVSISHDGQYVVAEFVAIVKT